MFSNPDAHLNGKILEYGEKPAEKSQGRYSEFIRTRTNLPSEGKPCSLKRPVSWLALYFTPLPGVVAPVVPAEAAYAYSSGGCRGLAPLSRLTLQGTFLRKYIWLILTYCNTMFVGLQQHGKRTIYKIPVQNSGKRISRMQTLL